MIYKIIVHPIVQKELQKLFEKILVAFGLTRVHKVILIVGPPQSETF